MFKYWWGPREIAEVRTSHGVRIGARGTESNPALFPRRRCSLSLLTRNLRAGRKSSARERELSGLELGGRLNVRGAQLGCSWFEVEEQPAAVT